MKSEISKFEYHDPRESIPGYVDLYALFEAPPHEEIWIASRLVPKGRMVSLVGPAKSGKSLLALNCGAAIASGREFLGAPTIKSRVLYIDQENIPLADVKPRLESMGYQWTDLEENFIYSSFGDFKDFNTAGGAEALLAIIREHKIQVVIIDTISRVISGKENDNDTWNELHRYLERQLKSDCISLLRLDHTGKDVFKGPRGASAKLGDVDMTIIVSTSGDGVIKLAVDGSRMPVNWTKIELIIVDEPNLGFIVNESHKESKESKEERVSRLVNLLDSWGVPRGITVEQTGHELRNRKVTAKTETVSAVTRRRKTDLGKMTMPSPGRAGWGWGWEPSFLRGEALMR